ncbi:polyphosphate kinase 2 [Blastopirellula retiformator]|uniref:ADP/GDP-polyphosphate phosphotransferase n=1 Tax=Blastopirellula retiformator TaxID=2527970 RepID=A0A5C5V2B2_9BACT|nr:polyphosphate kinase 2 [Blastopirellula retiformator]TWT32726.1 Thymidylate kinase [Blastopirellula retiformator]
MSKRSKSKDDHAKKNDSDLDQERDPRDRMKKKQYEKELERLQIELVKAQEWIKKQGTGFVVLFEGRDGAGKGSTIKRIAEKMNPRGCRVVALSKPSDVEQTQWYYQRYVAHLPSAGEIVLMDRSWYNRAGVERVMDFCTDEQYQEFLRSTPEFERMLIRSGIHLIKYWFSVSYEEQGRRFQKRLDQPDKRWKFSPMDIEARKRWYDYSKARDAMMAATDIPEAPWYVVPSDDKRRAHLNCISHLLSLGEYEDIPRKKIKLPKRDDDQPYENNLRGERRFIPQPY